MVEHPEYVDREVLVLTRNGIWLADGEEITHEPTRRLFSKSLKHDAAGYFLSIGQETKRVTVEDTAYFVVGLEGSARAGYEVVLSDESRERLDPATLKYQPGRLICRIKAGTEAAKFLHAPYIELLMGLEQDERGYYLEVGRKQVILARS